VGLDTLDGGAGLDTLTGGTGDDSLTGGTEADRFRYTALTDGDVIGSDGTTAEAGDSITGFVSGTDGFQFVASIFGGSAGAIDVNNFATLDAITQFDGTNGGTTNATNYYVFDVDTAGTGGTLYYDADEGTAGYVVVATLDATSNAVAATDIVLI
jgi:Ca2+-binding RTX toxin-like protein